MSTTTHDEMIAIIFAHKAGKQIEESDRDTIGNYRWFPFNLEYLFDFQHRVYRIKPEPPPKPREGFVHVDVIYEAAPHHRGNPSPNYIFVREVLPE